MDNTIKAIIFDRDGTLIEHVDYLSSPSGVRLLPGVKKGLKQLKIAGFELFLHSNQSGVGRGFFKLEQVYDCNKKMHDLIGLGPDLFSKTCIATEKPGVNISYRKPSPKFVNEIREEFRFEPSEVCYVGDRYSDLQTAYTADTYAIGVNTGLVDLSAELLEYPFLSKFQVVQSFDKVVEFLIAHKFPSDKSIGFPYCSKG